MMSEVEYYKKVARKAIQLYYTEVISGIITNHRGLDEDFIDETTEERLQTELDLSAYELADFMGWDAEEEPYDIYVEHMTE